MVRTVRDALVTALEDLEKKDLKKFCNKIRDWKIEEEYSKIPCSKLENADAEDIVTVIQNYYRDQYGAKLTVAVLKNINQNKVAQELEDNLAQMSGYSDKKPGGAETTSEVSGCSDKKPRGAEPTSEVVSPPAPKTKKVHFVDKHREDLIQGVGLIDPILDSLLSEKLLTYEQYDSIRSERRPQERVRELFTITRSWGEQDKDIFYQALKTHNRPLIDHLEKS